MPEPRRLDVDLLLPPDLVLVIDGEDYPVRGRLSNREMAHMLQLADRADDPDVSTENLIGLLDEAQGVVNAMIREKTPDAPDFDFGPGVMAVLTEIAVAATRRPGEEPGERTIRDEVVDGLTDDGEGSGQKTETDAREAARDLAEAVDEAEADVPLASPKRTPSRSSKSAKLSNGGRSKRGGKRSPGAASGSRSRTSSEK